LPLSERARIEVYVPDLPSPAYVNLTAALAREFTHTFGGCTIVRGLDGSYLSQSGATIQDRINLIYTDAPFPFAENVESLSRYADELQGAAFEALEEESVLVAMIRVHHAT
jgi:hypothetical protein